MSRFINSAQICFSIKNIDTFKWFKQKNWQVENRGYLTGVEEKEEVYHTRVKSSSLEILEQESLYATIHFTPEQRMEYLQKLREITHKIDEVEAKEKFISSKIIVSTFNENP